MRESRSSGLVSRIGAGVLAALLLGVAPRGEADLRLTREEYPVVDGSTSTQPLGMLVAGRVTRTSVEWRRSSFFDPTRLLSLTGARYDNSRKLSLEPTAAEPRGPDLGTALSSIGPFNAIRHDPTGIGYSYHYYERFMAAVPEVTTLAIDRIPPERATIASGRYPLGTAVYLAHRTDLPPGDAAARLCDWLHTPAGQAAIAESGYVPLRPAP